MVNVEIDEGSGFCFGVTTAIKKAEEELAKGTTLYCLGDIVHNGQECERLKKMGLITINHEEFARLHNPRCCSALMENRLKHTHWQKPTISKSSMQPAPWYCGCKNASNRNLTTPPTATIHKS